MVRVLVVEDEANIREMIALNPALLRTGPDAPCIPLCAGG